MRNRVSDPVAARRAVGLQPRRVKDPSPHKGAYSVSEQLQSAGGTCAFKKPDTR